MGASKIEWTDKVWNPVTGCTKVSAGCTNCYAERMSKRLAGRCGYPADEPFRVTLHLDRLEQPLRWRKPRRVFVCSMGDLFHPDVPDEFIAAVFGVMAACPRHTFQVLTKRPERMAKWFRWVQTDHALEGENQARSANYNIISCAALAGVEPPPVAHEHVDEGWQDRWPLPNVWLGTSAEDQDAADERIPHLLETPAAVRFVSFEPLLGPVDPTRVQMLAPKPPHGPGAWLNALNGHVIGPDDQTDMKLDWVIVGGESGPRARPMHPQWVRDIRDQCVSAGVSFFFKQWGEWWPAGGRIIENARMVIMGNEAFYRLGKKDAGRELDGLVWDEFPAEKDKE